ncbi:MAG: hypothetical protein H0W21_08635 [Actinobacteria bacterium]|nr:hypothetical protein [Actinomycetota bacterium]
MTAHARGEPTRRRSLHALATTGVAVFAVTGLLAMLAFVTVGWPGNTGRYLMAIFIGSVIGCLSCASAAVFTAARSTYPGHPEE